MVHVDGQIHQLLAELVCGLFARMCKPLLDEPIPATVDTLSDVKVVSSSALTLEVKARVFMYVYRQMLALVLSS